MLRTLPGCRTIRRKSGYLEKYHAFSPALLHVVEKSIL
jgi:hypothetical protein